MASLCWIHLIKTTEFLLIAKSEYKYVFGSFIDLLLKVPDLLGVPPVQDLHIRSTYN